MQNPGSLDRRFKSCTLLAVLLSILIFCPKENVAAKSSSSEGSEEEQTQKGDSKQKSQSTGGRWQVTWDDGLIIQEPWNLLSMRIGGMAQNDSTGFATELKDYETEQGRLENAVQWRRGRIYAEGNLLRHFEYKFQYDFATRNPPKLKDAFFGSRELPPPIPIPIGFRAGRFRTLIGLEGYTSSRDTLFMERGLPYAFVPSRNSGVIVFGQYPHSIDWGIGFIRGESEFLFDKAGKMGFIASAARQFQNIQKGILRAGANYQYRPARETARFLSRPEAHIAPQLVDTGQIPAHSDHLMLLEGSWIRRRLSLQAEYGWTWVRGKNELGQQNVSFNGGYVAGSYFLTDDDRAYSLKDGRFGHVVPKKPFGIDGGLGAWEIGFRYSHLDLDDKNIQGGILDDFTAGINWYPLYYFRFMLNTVYAKQNRLAGIWIFQARLQVAF